MLETETIEIPPIQQREQQVEKLLDVLIVLAKRRKLLMGLPLLGAAASLAISFALPVMYRAQTQLLPPQQQQSGAAALLAQFSGVAAAAAGASSLKNPNDLYIGMLKSRTVADHLIQKFDLRKRYELDSAEETRRQLASNTSISSGKDGLITIEVDDKSSEFVPKLANSYVEELLHLTSTLAVTEAAQRRLFFERQLQTARQNLASAEATLKGALDRNGVAIVDTESQAMAATIGRLRAQVSAKEIEISSMTAFVTTNNVEYKRAQEQLVSLRAELSRLQNGTAADATPEPAAPEGHTSGLKSAGLMRDVKYYQMLYELLAKQYEAARLDEAKDTPVVQVLDPAITPERKVKPRRIVMMIGGAFLGILIALCWVFITESKKRMLKFPGAAQRWSELRSQVGGK
jgi:uncharacterized protein involved in exopolysaccharide biosynthesis